MALISRFQQSSAFQQTLEKINAGESVWIVVQILAFGNLFLPLESVNFF